ncbi:MAG: glycyl-radical enzyme activating protein [Lachnospirales bacterium]
MSKGVIFDIKEFSVYDGPDIRTTVFLKGCPLRCIWCHNPEGLKIEKEIMFSEQGCLHCNKCKQPCSHKECVGLERCIKSCPQGKIRLKGEEVVATDLSKRLIEQANFFESSGVTFSGGEPTMQPEFLLEMLYLLKNMHTVVETCAYTDEVVFKEVMEMSDLMYIDIKYMDRDVHKKLTGVYNDIIFKNIETIEKSGKNFVLRIPVIYGINDDEKNIKETINFAKDISGLISLDFLSYNHFAGSKYKMLNKKYILEGKINKNKKINLPISLLEEARINYKIFEL